MNFLLLFLIPILFIAPAYAEIQTLSSDKSEYSDGDTITISGQVNLNSDIPAIIIVQILTPNGVFADFDQTPLNNDGSFSMTFRAGGPTWSSDGTYTVKASYGGTSETSFDFSEESQTSQQNPSNEQNQNNQPEIISNEQPQISNSPSMKETNQKPKTHIPDFPSLYKSPQYYIDRYNNEPAYEEWFVSQFPGESIEDVVGYDATHIPGFPSIENSPQYYITRYNTELDFEAWFDSQFPGKTIYQVLGFPEPNSVPSWIKHNAEWWSTGQITDSDFLDGIEYMVKNHIIVIQSMPKTPTVTGEDVPDWVRNNASWWAQNKISEEEFLNGIKFLIQNGILVV